jgi:DNA-binding response OmpR family regulator/predicted Ser/Thr protein kinase
MSKHATSGFLFGPFFLDIDGRRLLRNGKRIHLGPLEINLLEILIRNRGRVLKSDELRILGWGQNPNKIGTIYQDKNALYVSLGKLRKALSEYRSWIVTISKVGYTFSDEVEVREIIAAPDNLPLQSRNSANYTELTSPASDNTSKLNSIRNHFHEAETTHKSSYTIGEVCEITGVQAHVLRYWESEFPMLAPYKNPSGIRTYRKSDIQIARRIKELLYDDQYTIAGAKKQLAAELRGAVSPRDNTPKEISLAGLTPKSDSIKIIIADDDPNYCALMRRILEDAGGYQVSIAQDGREVLGKIRGERPNLVILDFVISEIDGLEICRLLKSDEITQDIPIIFLSAHGDTKAIVDALSLGANDYISKPFHADELLARVNAALRLRRTTKDQKSRGNKTRDPYRITGDILAGKYRLVEYSGGGGMGAVYRALDLNHHNVVAIKILKPDIVVRNPEYAELFEKEVKTAQKLNHPHIVRVLDRGEDDGITFMVMEWLEGKHLEDVLMEESLSLNRIISIFEQICNAVAHAHESNVIHLDLKPSNILLLRDKQPQDFVKVIDFGLARIISRESGTTVTRFRGTHQYCAPEQFGGKVSSRSDIYSLGATLYHLISGVIPFGASYINAKVHPNLELPDIPSLAKPPCNLPTEVDQVIKKALSKNPDDRQQSVRELFEAFSSAISIAR